MKKYCERQRNTNSVVDGSFLSLPLSTFLSSARFSTDAFAFSSRYRNVRVCLLFVFLFCPFLPALTSLCPSPSIQKKRRADCTAYHCKPPSSTHMTDSSVRQRKRILRRAHVLHRSASGELSHESFAPVNHSQPTRAQQTFVPSRRKTEALTCSICEGLAHGYNFDAITCESCKAFFRRNALKADVRTSARSRAHWHSSMSLLSGHSQVPSEQRAMHHHRLDEKAMQSVPISQMFSERSVRLRCSL